jgi:catechol 2,3-dioxygenase-like lactoylglutathione lyase family enzyme
MIKGINHITLSVKSLEESFEFYKDVLGFRPLMCRGKSAYFLAGDLWFCIEEDRNIREGALPEYTHIAFSVEQKEFEAVRNKIQSAGTEIFKENKSEGSSLYFIDPNGHKLEIHVGDWRSRLDAYKDDEDTIFY